MPDETDCVKNVTGATSPMAQLQLLQQLRYALLELSGGAVRERLSNLGHGHVAQNSIEHGEGRLLGRLPRRGVSGERRPGRLDRRRQPPRPGTAVTTNGSVAIGGGPAAANDRSVAIERRRGDHRGRAGDSRQPERRHKRRHGDDRRWPSAAAIELMHVDAVTVTNQSSISVPVPRTRPQTAWCWSR